MQVIPRVRALPQAEPLISNRGDTHATFFDLADPGPWAPDTVRLGITPSPAVWFRARDGALPAIAGVDLVRVDEFTYAGHLGRGYVRVLVGKDLRWIGIEWSVPRVETASNSTVLDLGEARKAIGSVARVFLNSFGSAAEEELVPLSRLDLFNDQLVSGDVGQFLHQVGLVLIATVRRGNRVELYYDERGTTTGLAVVSKAGRTVARLYRRTLSVGVVGDGGEEVLRWEFQFDRRQLRRWLSSPSELTRETVECLVGWRSEVLKLPEVLTGLGVGREVDRAGMEGRLRTRSRSTFVTWVDDVLLDHPVRVSPPTDAKYKWMLRSDAVALAYFLTRARDLRVSPLYAPAPARQPWEEYCSPSWAR